MKKIILGLLLLISVSIFSPVMAKTAQFEALSPFSTENPPKTMQVKVITNIQLDDNLTLFEGYIVTGKIVDVTDPKRLKRDANFAFIPTSYTNFQNEVVPIEKEYVGKYTTAMDKGAVVKSAALGVGNYFVKGLSSGVAAVEGAVKNEENNRLKSSAVAVYENSPLSYVEKGEELVINKNQLFLLNFRTKEDEQQLEPNYEYAPASQEQIDNANKVQPAGNISKEVNKAAPVIMKEEPRLKTKEFPGEKLESFDNSSNFNIPEKPVFETDKINNNINSLKRTPEN